MEALKSRLTQSKYGKAMAALTLQKPLTVTSP